MPYNANDGKYIGEHTPRRQLWLAADVAQCLRISKDEVYRLVERLEIPHTRIFKRKGIRFHPDEIEDWTKSELRPPQPEDARG